MAENALTIEDLSVALDGHPILEHLTFTVPAGETTAIIGPNGAGKSVLLKAILRLIPKTSGRVEIFGVPHESYRQIAHVVSYIPQKLAFDRAFPLTVRGLFSLKSKQYFGMSVAERERMENLLMLVGMEKYADHKISTLSGGQMQRVLLGYSLMDQPKLLILDEPSAGIDVHGHETVYTLLRRIQSEQALTLLLVSHELEIVMQYATQVLCLNRQLLCAGRPREVLSNDLLEKMYGSPVGHYSHVDHTHHA